MPKRLLLPATAVLLLLAACGTGKPAAGLPTDADALLKRAKEAMIAQPGFAVDQCEGYWACEPGPKNFSLTYGADTMLLRVDGYELVPYTLVSGPDWFYSEDGAHWTYAYHRGVDDSLYVDPRVVLSLAVHPKMEGSEGISGREQVRLSASLDLQRWVQQRMSHGWGSITGSLKVAPTLPPFAPPQALPAFDRHKIEMQGWEVREVYPGTQYVLVKGLSSMIVTGYSIILELYGFHEVSTELKQELGQVLAAFGIPAERIDEVEFHVDDASVFTTDDSVPAEATFWLDSESSLVTKMTVVKRQYDPALGQAQAGPGGGVIALSFKYGGEGPQPPQEVLNYHFANLVLDDASYAATTVATLVTRYYDAHGICPDVATPDSLATELAAKGWEWPRNSYQERPARESDAFSAGDYKYERSGDGECRLVGWGWGQNAPQEVPYRFP